MFPNLDPVLLYGGTVPAQSLVSIARWKDLGLGSVLMDSGKMFQSLVVLGIKDCLKSDVLLFGSVRLVALRRARPVLSCLVCGSMSLM